MADQIGHYKILRKLGQGGMGEVYCAQDTSLGRMVALKILSPDVAKDEQRLHRFLREARVAATLSHPNVTHIYEVGVEGDIHFIAMEYVEGITLQERIQREPIDNETLIRIAHQTAEGLLAAHSLGIVHRDVKPGNIMLDSRENVKIVDFGLARQHWAIGPDANRLSTEANTRTGTILGTFPYMSPEQALGKTVDHRSDIFSFGIVLYEMATGRHPFYATTPTATLAQIITTQPDSPARINSKLLPEMNHLIEKCMRKSADDRYQSLADLIVDLQRMMEVPHGQRAEHTLSQKEYLMTRGVARVCFIALQCMYLVFYVCALRWSDAMEQGLNEILSAQAASHLMLAFILTAVLGMAVRLHMMFLVIWDHISTGVQFRKVFPLLLMLDALWAFAPFGLLQKVQGIFLLVCVPPLAFSPISQRTLIRSAYDLHAMKRISVEEEASTVDAPR